MLFQQLPVLAALAATALSLPTDGLEKRSQTCTNGAVVFMVRGSDPMQKTLGYNPRYDAQPAGTRNVANAIIQKAGGNSYASSIQYPAIDPATGQYGQSVQDGVAAIQGAIRDYVNACSTGQIFVIGYSQGAQATTGALAGSTDYPPLAVHGRLTGAVAFADPSFHDNYYPVDQGSGAYNGVDGTVPGDGSKYRFLQQNFAKRARTYCQEGDRFCDSGNGKSESDALAIHYDSPEHFQDAATKFMLSITN